LVLPMSPQDVVKAFEKQGMTRGAAISGLVLMGMGAQQIEPQKNKPGKRKAGRYIRE
jgi:hypothetical protein